jgi:hypothetical protein
MRQGATTDLWHAAGRAAREGRKRLLALQGVLWSAPVLVLGSALWRLAVPAPAPGLDPAGLARPFSYAFEPLRWAHENDRDLALVAWFGIQALLLAALWALFGGAISRLAAVDLAKGRAEGSGEALAFARRHWRGAFGARVALWGAVAVPLALAAGAAAVGRVPGPIGTVLLAVVTLVAVALVLCAVVVASVLLVAGFLPGPTVACEDSDAFDAVSRTFTYAAAGLPRVLWTRLVFLGGVAIGTGWRALRAVAVLGLAYACLRAGAGPGPLDRAAAVLGAGGTPHDADRLGVGAADVALAAALAFAAGGVVALWLADLLSRVLCARVGAYLALRLAVDGVPTSTLRTPPRDPPHRTAQEAGFVEVSRIEG